MVYLDNLVCEIDHPSVHRLLAGDITREQFVAELTPEDPFAVEVMRGDTLVAGFTPERLRTTRTGIRTAAVASVRTMYGIHPGKLPAEGPAADTIRGIWPATEPVFAALREQLKDAGCPGCARTAEGIRIIRLMTPRSEYAPELEVLRSLCPPVGFRILCGDTTVSDAEIAQTLTPTPLSRAKEYPKLPAREVFFDSKDCGKGTSEENCRRCRTDIEHRHSLTMRYRLPAAYTVTAGGADMTLQVCVHPGMPAGFDCPFMDIVGREYPPLVQQARNAFGAFTRTVKALVSGKSVSLHPRVVHARMEVCRKCPKMDPLPRRCSACGCYIHLKVALATEDCPDGRWPTLVEETK